LVEVESADLACWEDGPLLGPPRLLVRPRSQPAVCAAVENGARTGAMIAATDAEEHHRLSDVWNRVLDEPLTSAEIAQDACAGSFSVPAGYRIYCPGHAIRGGTRTPAAVSPV
jgi:hypothetical protein